MHVLPQFFANASPYQLAFVAIVVLAVLSPILWQFFAGCKGSININTDDRNFVNGQTITGTVVVNPNKRMHAKEILVSLKAKRRTNRNHGGSSSRYYKTIHDIPLYLTQNEELRAGEIVEYPFTFEIPIDHDEIITDAVKEKLADVPMGNLMIGAMKALSKRLEWELTAQVDCDGIDLHTKHRISVRHDAARAAAALS